MQVLRVRAADPNTELYCNWKYLSQANMMAREHTSDTLPIIKCSSGQFAKGVHHKLPSRAVAANAVSTQLTECRLGPIHCPIL